jgi:hypothetical protein
MSPAKITSGAINLQDRDLALLRGLFESRIMTAGHIVTLYFDGKREYTKKRLQRMKAAGLVSERRRRVNEPAILFLTRKAFSLLNSQGHLSQFPAIGGKAFEVRANVSELTVHHELEVMDVKAAFHDAFSKSDKFSIIEFSTWPLLCQFETTLTGNGGETLVKPDGFISIHEKEPGIKGFAHDCFLEVDRSSEKLDTLVNKALCYLEYYKSGGFAVRNGASRTDFKSYPFRVLMVLKSIERRNNIAERLIQNNPPILTQTWLTTLKEVTADSLGAIWVQPVDYRNATNGTQFQTEERNYGFAYRRQAERDAFVEARIKKLRLLES